MPDKVEVQGDGIWVSIHHKMTSSQLRKLASGCFLAAQSFDGYPDRSGNVTLREEANAALRHLFDEIRREQVGR